MKKERGFVLSKFNYVIERKKTHSVKWDRLAEVYSLDDGKDILPMWIADMDFAAPSVVIDAMMERLEHGVLGYSFVSDDQKDSIRNWLREQHAWEIDNDWIQFQQGVVPAIASIIESLTSKDDGILITTPVYPPFFNIPGRLERTIVESVMLEDKGNYSIDFEDFEKALQKNVKLFILCNPHNPGGVVWTREELQKIIELCTKYDVLILSDEIHADLVFPEFNHISLATIAGEETNRIITCVAPTKTFNLAGVQAAIMISPDPVIREKLEENAMAHGYMGISPLSATALKAAFDKGKPWLEELLEIVSANMDYVIREIPAAIPGIKINKPHGTYLLWFDYRETGLSEKEIMDKLLHRGQLALEPGTKYGEAGRGFLRMNVACPPALVEDGVNRFIKALQN